MPTPRSVFPVLPPTLALGAVLANAIVLTSLLLLTFGPELPRATTVALAAVGCAVTVAEAAVALIVGRRFQHSFVEVTRTLESASIRLGQDPPAPGRGFADVAKPLRSLLGGIDRILEERRQREREVMRADQLSMVGQIAAGVAHELRNPLTSVKMLVQTNLREATRLGVPSDDLEIIEQEIRRMERCLQRFLDFARPPKPEIRPVSVPELVDQTFALVEGRARRQQVALRFPRTSIPIVAEADEDQIRQLIVNLVLNALDAMPDGGEIEVRLDCTDDGFAELRVMDTGPGIPETLFPTLFDPFVSTKETGIGLGLAVSHRIAAGHGGNLSAVNRPAGGAEFLLRLPVSQRPVS